MKVTNNKIKGKMIADAIDIADELIRKHFNEIVEYKEHADKITFSISYEIESPSKGSDKDSGAINYSKKATGRVAPARTIRL